MATALDADLDEQDRPRGERPDDRRAVALAVALVALAALPLLVAVVARAGRSWIPAQDLAVVDLRARDVLSSSPPLVGPYSRYGWSHPGPWFFYLLAPLSRLAGGQAWGVLVGAVLVQLATVAAIGRVAWRSGGLALVAVTMPVVAVSLASVGPALVLEPWNPHVALLGFVLFVLLCWRSSLGEGRLFAGLAVVGSLLAQTHVGYVPLVAAGTAVVVGGAVVDRVRHRSSTVRRSHLVATGVVLAVVWAPVVVEQILGSPGNLTRLVEAVQGDNGGEVVAGWATGLGLLARQFQVLPPWLGGSDPVEPIVGTISGGSLWWLLLPVAALAAGSVAAVRSGRRADLRWVVLMGVLLVVGADTLRRTTGQLVPYLFLWRVPLAVLVLVASGWAVAGAWRGRRHPAAGAVGLAVAFVVVAGATVPLAVGVARHPDAVMAFETDAEALLAQLDGAPAPRGAVQLRFVGSTLGGLPGIVVNEADRRGVAVGVPRSLGFQFGEDRVVSDPDEVWVVTEQGWHTSELVAEPGGTVLARSMPLGPDREAELAELQRRLSVQMVEAGAADRRDALDSPLVAFALADVAGLAQADLHRLAELNAASAATGRCRCAVVAYEPWDVPTWAPEPRYSPNP